MIIAIITHCTITTTTSTSIIGNSTELVVLVAMATVVMVTIVEGVLLMT